MNAPLYEDFARADEWLAALDSYHKQTESAYMRLSNLLSSEIGPLEWNGRSGRLLGERLLAEEALLGEPVQEWRLRELLDFLRRVSAEYNLAYEARQKGAAA